MGADYSMLSDSTIDETPILTTKDWSLHHAQNVDHGSLSVFIGPEGQKDARINTLADNLKQFRHPGILRFLGWVNSGGGHLLTEKASPLTIVRSLQSEQALCLGLRQVAEALLFLHEKGGVLHNNICQNAIFVTPGGRWKLAGLEMTSKLDHHHPLQRQAEKSRDVLALGILITEVLKDSRDEEAVRFREYARDQMLLPDSARRPDLHAVMNQPYFHQDFVAIFAFLQDITLKTEEEKEDFFSTLGEQLEQVPEPVIGQLFVPLLLSRYVLVDKTARSQFLSRILIPRSVQNTSLLSEKCFQDHVLPQMRTMFSVCDTGIRMVLLEHFSEYCSAIDVDTLEDDVLPALLLGLRDNNPLLVAATLRALADLVPLLGPAKVIGTDRAKIFSDGSPARGRPHSGQLPALRTEAELVREYVRARQGEERVPPLGAEQDETVDIAIESDAEGWDAWEVQEEGEEEDKEDATRTEQKRTHGKVDHLQQQPKHQQQRPPVRLTEVDIHALDVKLSAGSGAQQRADHGLDFFADMAPVIPKAKSDLEQFQSQLDNARKMAEAKFAPVCDTEENGWDDDDWKD